MLLAFDTSTPLVTVALCDPTSGGLLHRASSTAPMKHGEQLAPLIDAALRAVGATRTDLTRIVVGAGPGPFTGLRVGLVTARVLGLALDLPVAGVCTLDVLACQAVDSGVAGPFLVTIDARRKELFWAAYDADGARTDGPHVDKPAELPSGLPVVGAGPVLYPDLLTGSGPVDPDAGVLATAYVAGRLHELPPEPIYLRRPDAVVPGPPKKVS